MSLHYAAHPMLYGRPGSALPPEVLQLDMRGVVTASEDPPMLSVECVEAKSGRDFGKAVRQLELRLNILTWVLKQLDPPYQTTIPVCVGHVFVPLSDDDNDDLTAVIAEAQRKGFSLYIHPLQLV